MIEAEGQLSQAEEVESERRASRDDVDGAVAVLLAVERLSAGRCITYGKKERVR